jgi:phage terminase large subunit-like protein
MTAERDVPDVESWRRWTPAAQQKALEALQNAVNETWRPFYCENPDCDGRPHGEWDWSHARASQRPPRDPQWLTWLLKSGRGAGKTRAGAELTHRMTDHVGRIALVGATGADVRDVLLEGESGLLTIAPPGKRPRFEPSKRRLTWPNQCIATTFSAEEPDRLRGPEHGFAWVDEAAHFPLIQDTWDNLLLGLRIGRRPRVVVTTTPKPRPWLRTLIADPTTRVTTASTYDNIANLAPVFAERIMARYEGTRLGRQEILGEVLEDIEGALWTWAMIEPDRLATAPLQMQRVVIGVDPAGSGSAKRDETGIVAAGLLDDQLYVLADRSGHYSPFGWARAVDALYEEYSADAVVAEVNYGGDMVSANLRAAGIAKRVITVHSRRGKALRAEPIVGVYEQHRAHHVGVLTELEEQMTTWQPYEDRDSPDRVDALVHAATSLLGRRAESSIATPASLRAQQERQSRRHLGPQVGAR